MIFTAGNLFPLSFMYWVTRIKTLPGFEPGSPAWQGDDLPTVLSLPTFATDVGSNFSTGVRNTTDHEPVQSIREAFSLRFWSQKLSVTINWID